MTTPVDRVRIFDREGIELVQFQASVSRSWALGDEGRAQFEYPSRKTEIVNRRVMQFGNWLLIENNLLPPWVGVFDPPRKWAPRVATFSAYTPERVFGWRRGPIEEKLTGSPGTVFEKLLYYVNMNETTILRAGEIYKGGTQMEETINPTLLNRDLERIFERSGEEYQFRPLVMNGRLVVYCDWRPSLGTDTGILLQEGKNGGNIESYGNIIVEDGDIVNDLLAVGDGETWKGRPTATVTDVISKGDYGLRQATEEYSGVSSVDTLKNNGAEYIANSKNPANAYKVNVINQSDVFKYIAIGNFFTLRLQNIGFTSGNLGIDRAVRITSMSYNPDAKNKVQLVVEDA